MQIRQERTITFGICTYNRKDILEKTAGSIKLIEGIEKVHLRIYDDCSTDFDTVFLHSLFPTAETIHVQKHNMGADYNTSYMYQDFLKSDDDILLTADADLLFRKDSIQFILENIDKTDGFFSLFNSPTHETVATADELFVEKADVGAAGCCFTKQIIELVLSQTNKYSAQFDYDFCQCMKNNHIRILATKESVVQHIGVNGYNSTLFFDYGMGFKVDSEHNAKVIEETFEEHMRNLYDLKKSGKWKLFENTFLIPSRIVRKIKWMQREKKARALEEK